MSAHKNGRPATATHELHAEYTTLRRLERHLRREAQAQGLPGDPLDTPRLGTLRQHAAALELWHDLPTDLRRHPAAWPMAQAAGGGGR